MFILKKQFQFEASHQLPNHDGKCARLHGHSWVIVVWVKGSHLITKGCKQGMVVDYGDIAKATKPLIENYLDHYHLNDSTGLTNPTSESIAKWCYDHLKKTLECLYAIEIQETCTSSCIYFGEPTSSPIFD